MKWSARIGTFAGIGLYVHATFLILIAWVAFVYWQAEGDARGALAGVAFVLALFACVALHEFGHALTAARFGIRTRDITLLPIGGIARLERMPDEPRQELLVALVGPAVNVAIAAGLYVLRALSGSAAIPASASMVEGPFVERLMVVNVFLVAFNMLPAFPMDGGRVLRAALALRMTYARATQLAATVGQGMALLFGLAGLFGNPFLILIALFVWIGATQEAAVTQIKATLAGIPVEQAMITDFRTLAPSDTLAHATDLMLAGAQGDFPVVAGDRVVGVLTRADLLGALANVPRESAVSGVMRGDVPTAEATEMIELAFERLRGCNCHTMPVLRQGRLVGLLTMENVGEFVSVQTAMSPPRQRARPRP